MADRYWAVATGTWNSSNTANWSASPTLTPTGASVPTSADNVFFTLASTYTVTLSGAINCANLTVSAGSPTFSSSGTLSIAGSFALTTTTVWSASGLITFTSTTTGNTINTAGRTLSPSVTFNGVGGGWTLAGAFNSGGNLTFTAGAFSTNNFAFTVASLNTSGTLTRSLTLGSSAVAVAGSVIFTGTGFTLSAGSSTITLASTSSSIFGNGAAFNTAIFSSSSISTVTISDNNSFSTLTIQGRLSPGLARIEFGGNQTIGTLSVGSGGSVPARTMLRSTEINVTRTLTVTTFSATSDIDFRDITIAGSAAPISGNRFGDCKGNSGITFPAAKTVYYAATGSTSWGLTGAGSWSATSGGAASAVSFPLAQDTAVFPATIPNTGTTTTINAGYNIGTIDMSLRTGNTMTLATGVQLPLIYGNWINGTGITLTGSSELLFAGRGSQTITSAGRTFAQPITVNSLAGSVTLLDAFNSSSVSSIALLVTAGTLNANGFNITAGSGGFAFGSGTFSKTAAIGSGTWAFGNTIPWNALGVSNATVTGTGTLNMLTPLSSTFYGGGIQTYPKLNQGGNSPLTIDGSNGFSEISNTVIAAFSVITFGAATTTTVGDFTVAGNATTRMQLRSTSTGTRFILSKPSGTVNGNYLDIRDSNATGGAVWNAGSTSLNSGNNLGWIFTTAGGTGNMLMMFLP